jgi:microsomal dipeptidase-like Zn-dependent dipeptidase
MGQKGIEHPVIGFRNVIKECIRIGYGDEDIRKMVATNPLRLLGMEA